ncbi:class I SAM-dependent methyltransferase [Dysgonomonas termitidis]|uniref:Class I SAM-dependent methyltransferase n=1 Tax=Dysgonomonas termitidis TaxID=1516126 RepID=A0ABV9KR77_9BACT
MKEESIISNYNNFDENKRAFGSKAEQIEFIYTQKLLDQYIKPYMSVAELGCGTGYYGFYLSKKCQSYHGIDITPRHVEQFQKKIKEQELSYLSVSVGDATDLPDIADNTFDVVLVFGPMYHLPREERIRVIQESKRICKTNGLIMFAYINKIGAYLRGCIDENLKANYPNKKTNELVLSQGVDDVLPDVFFFTMPEEIEHDVTTNGLTVIQNVGVDFTFNASDINVMDDEKYAAWTEVMDYMFHCNSCTGVSNHAVLVCRNLL